MHHTMTPGAKMNQGVVPDAPVPPPPPLIKTFLFTGLFNIIQIIDRGNTNDEITVKINQLKQGLHCVHVITCLKEENLNHILLMYSFGLEEYSGPPEILSLLWIAVSKFQGEGKADSILSVNSTRLCWFQFSLFELGAAGDPTTRTYGSPFSVCFWDSLQ